MIIRKLRRILPGLPWLMLPMMLLPAIAADRTTRVIGEAHDLKSDELLYREVYCESTEGGETDVLYRDDLGQLIARKMLDYESGPMTPSFVQRNYYSSEVIEVALDNDLVSMKVFDAESAAAKKSSSKSSTGELPLVIDAGFDEFVRAHWDDLVAGEKKTFLFPFADRAKLVELRIKQAQCSYSSSTDQCFKLELSNWFLRLLVAPIELGYDPARQRLLRYRGLSNIGDGKGNGSVVDIRYRYRDLPAMACAIDDAVIESGSSARWLLPSPGGLS